jgi:hypothetical protein
VVPAFFCTAVETLTAHAKLVPRTEVRSGSAEQPGPVLGLPLCVSAALRASAASEGHGAQHLEATEQQRMGELPFGTLRLAVLGDLLSLA